MTTATTPDLSALSSIETRTPAELIAVARDLITLRDLAYANNDRKVYVEAFTALRKIDGHWIAAAEAELKARARAEREAARQAEVD